jgi:hypothetical protein
MPYFQDATGELHYLSDEDVANGGQRLLPPDCNPITDSQAAAIQNPPLTLAQAQSVRVNAITQAYENAVVQAVSFTTEAGVVKTFQADPASQNVLVQSMQGYNLAGAVPAGFYWISADNTQVTFTLADLKGLYAAMLAQGWAAFQKKQTLKSQVKAAASVAAVQAVMW